MTRGEASSTVSSYRNNKPRLYKFENGFGIVPISKTTLIVIKYLDYSFSTLYSHSVKD